MKPSSPRTPLKPVSKAANGHATRHGPSAHAGQAAAPSVADVAARAYLNYQNHGGIDGHDVEDWLAAETALAAEHGLAHT